MLFAYLGPETTLPLASTAAAAMGVVMMFGRSVVRVVKKWAVKDSQGVPGTSAIAAGRRWSRGL
jgi:hypothetical protein